MHKFKEEVRKILTKAWGKYIFASLMKFYKKNKDQHFTRSQKFKQFHYNNYC